MAVKWAAALLTNGQSPISIVAMLTDLISEIDAHLAWRADHNAPLKDTTFGLRAVNDGKLIKRLRAGKEITVGKMGAVREWIAADRKATIAQAGRATQDAERAA